MPTLKPKFSGNEPKDLSTKPHWWHLAPIPWGQPVAENGADGRKKGERKDISKGLQMG